MLFFFHRSLCFALAVLSLHALCSPVSFELSARAASASPAQTTRAVNSSKSASSVASTAARPTQSKAKSSASSSASSASPSDSATFGNITVADPATYCAEYKKLLKGADPVVNDITNSPTPNNSTSKAERSRRGQTPSRPPGPRKESVQSDYYGKTTLTTKGLTLKGSGSYNIRVVQVLDASWNVNRQCSSENPSILKEVETRREFDKETRILSSLNQLWDKGKVKNGNYYFVMTKIPGKALKNTRTYKEAKRRQATDEVYLDAAKSVMEAMYYAYTHTGYVHTDPHQNNVFFIEEYSQSRQKYRLITGNMLDWGEAEQPPYSRDLSEHEFYRIYYPRVKEWWGIR